MAAVNLIKSYCVPAFYGLTLVKFGICHQHIGVAGGVVCVCVCVKKLGVIYRENL